MAPLTPEGALTGPQTLNAALSLWLQVRSGPQTHPRSRLAAVAPALINKILLAPRVEGSCNRDHEVAGSRRPKSCPTRLSAVWDDRTHLQPLPSSRWATAGPRAGQSSLGHSEGEGPLKWGAWGPFSPGLKIAKC